MGEWMMMTPSKVNVMRVITYDIDEVRKDMGLKLSTTEEVIDFLEDWVTEDFGTTTGLVYQDENGDDLQ